MKMYNYKKQHPFAIIHNFLKELKGFIFPLILVFGLSLFTGQSTDFNIMYYLFPLSILALSLLYSILKYFFFTYAYIDNTIIIKQGVFIKKTRTIKKDRIQTINIEASVLLRLFKLVSLNIETAGGLSEAELSISAIKRRDAETLKNSIENKTTMEVKKNYGYKVTNKRLFIAGLTSGSVGFVLAITFAIISQIIALLPGETLTSLFTSASALNIVIIGALIVFYILFAWVISLVRYVIRYAAFKVSKDEDRLMVERGLLKLKSLTLKRHRIQAISFIKGLLRQPFDYQAVEVDVAGGTKFKEQSKTIVHPLIKNHEVDGFLSYAVPEYKPLKPQLRPPKKALKRYLFRGNILLILSLLLTFISPLFWWLLILLPLTLILAYYRYKHASLAVEDNHFQCASRTIALTTTLTMKKHIQSMELKQNIFQQIGNLVTIEITILSSPSRAIYRVKDIALDEALTLYSWYQNL